MNNMQKKSIVFVFAVHFGLFFLVRLGVLASEPMGVDQLLRVYRDSIAHLNSFSFDYMEKDMISRTSAKPSLYSTVDGSVKYNRESLWMEKKETIAEDQSLDVEEEVYSPKERLLLTKNQQNLDMNKLEFAFMGNIRDEWNVSKLTEKFPYPFILGKFRCFWVADYQLCSLDSFFLEKSSVVETVNVGKKNLVQIRGIVDKSDTKVETTACFDPEYNFALRSIKFVVTMKGFSSPITHETVIVEFCQLGDFYYPAKFIMKSKIPPGEVISKGTKIKQPPYEHEITVELSRFHLANFQESDFCITTDAPDYTPVYMQDAPQIKYIWLDGKTVPLTDELALARARGHKFMPGPDEPRFWLMGIGLAMIILACGKKGYDYFKNKS